MPKCFFIRAISVSSVGYGSLSVTNRPMPVVGSFGVGVMGAEERTSPRPFTIQSLTPPWAASQAVWGE